MTSQSPLPTIPQLHPVPLDLDVKQITAEWFHKFATNVEIGNCDGIIGLFVENPYWRDILALTWDFRTFNGKPRIKQFLTDRLPSVHMRTLRLREDFLNLQKPFPDVAWIQALFDFETDVGIGSGVIRLVPTENGDWKGHCILTNLEDLKGFPEHTGALRNHEPNHGNWATQRRLEAEYKDRDPVVLICGGGQSGLQLAARLKCLNIPSLVVEKNPRIGDNWRNRYESLSLHDPVWYHHMPYIPFPPTWPVYTPAEKLGDWLEFYANSLELNVWTSAAVTNASQDASNKWNVTVKRDDGLERVFRVNHFVLATGIGSGAPKIPSYPGMDQFSGRILHSLSYKKATDHVGKNVVVLGSCCSAHDIAVDHCNHGIDVTMVQRGPTYVMTTKNGWKSVFEGGLYWENSPPTDVADRIGVSFPNPLLDCIAQRQAEQIAEADREILDGLRKRGFKLSVDHRNAKFLVQGCVRTGGYYLDVGGSQLIIDGKINLKSGSQIERFTVDGLRFEDGSELPADVVICATGTGDAGDLIRQLCGDKIANSCQHIWSLNEEGEFNTCWRDLGFPGLWYMMGNLGLCRFYSKRIALQIKGIEENVFSTRYSL